MHIQTVWPLTKIDTSAQVFVMYDHMAHIDLFNLQDKTYEELKLEFFGKNNYILAFDCNPRDIANKFFVFDSYVFLKEFYNTSNSIFLPAYFYNCALTSNAQINQIDFNNKCVDFNCMMRNHRYNRIIASCWLYNNKDQLNFNYTQSWDSDEKYDLLFELLKIGDLATWEGSCYKIKNLDKKYIPESSKSTIMSTMYVDNQEYQHMFTNSAISVVLGVNFWEYGCSLDEKYLNAIYAGTIPIHDGYGFYDTVKKLGFDVFDDIVDTSSQYESNPCVRTWNTLEKNRKLLTHGLDYIHRADIQERVLNNYQLAMCPEKFLINGFKNLNTSTAQCLYLEKYQKFIKKSTEYKWPLIDL
jgi:hypothetical protein